MDVNFSSTSITSARKDSMAHLAEQKSNTTQEALPDSGIQTSGDQARSVNKVNQASQADAENLQQAVNDIAKSMNVMQKGLAFNVDEESGMQVVKVIDIQTGDLIRQIPNEEALDIAKKLNEVAGLLMKTEV
jgi:flagellar protein FlaG